MQNTTSARRGAPPRRRARSRPSVVWRSPERHLWVATDDGEYAGMAVYDGIHGYTATGATAAPIGRFRSLAAAKAALEAHA